MVLLLGFLKGISWDSKGSDTWFWIFGVDMMVIFFQQDIHSQYGESINGDLMVI